MSSPASIAPKAIPLADERSRWNFAYAYVFFISIFLGQTIRFYVGSEPLLGA